MSQSLAILSILGLLSLWSLLHLLSLFDAFNHTSFLVELALVGLVSWTVEAILACLLAWSFFCRIFAALTRLDWLAGSTTGSGVWFLIALAEFLLGRGWGLWLGPALEGWASGGGGSAGEQTNITVGRISSTGILGGTTSVGGPGHGRITSIGGPGLAGSSGSVC